MDPTDLESHRFNSLKNFAMLLGILGIIGVCAGFMIVGDDGRTSLQVAIGTIVSSLSLIGVASMLGAVASIGEICRETFLRAERLIAEANQRRAS